MAIIKARTNRVRMMRHICRLQEPNRDTLVLYARFIGDTVDYIVNQLIDSTIAKDREFVAWRAAQRGGATPQPISGDHADSGRSRVEDRR